MTKKVNDVVKAFGNDVEEATRKLQTKFKGFCVLHPEFQDAELEYDAGPFCKDGKEMYWAKLFQTIELPDEKPANHPEMKSAKKSRKAKVA